MSTVWALEDTEGETTADIPPIVRDAANAGLLSATITKIGLTPLTVLRRFDCLLALTKDQLLFTFNQVKGKLESIIRSEMQSVTGHPFYNLVKLEMASVEKWTR